MNLLDTPGYPDFVGELRAGLRAADAALFVVAATGGVDGATKLLWEECARAGTPRAIVLTKLEHARADYEAALAACQQAFGDGVLPLCRFRDGAVVDLLAEPADDDPASSGARSALIEGIIAESEDESLLDRYLAGEALDPATLLADLETAVERGSFFPVVVTARPHLGTTELLDLVVNAFPPPQHHPLPEVTRPDGSTCPPTSADPDGPLIAEVVRTATDPYVGRMSVVRVFSGTLRPDIPVHVSGHHGDGHHGDGHRPDQAAAAVPGAAPRPDHDDDERTGALSRPDGTALVPVEACPAGGICVVTKLSSAATGDTLSDRDDPRRLATWRMPEPLLPVAVVARSRADEDKLATALARLTAEDATLLIEQNAETGQLVLWCMGETHAEVVVERLAARHSVAVDRVELRVPLRETVTGPGRGLGRNVKQSGGHGQYAVCHVEMEPLPTGGGFEFVDEVVGGAVPRAFIGSVEKGVRAQLGRGVLAGYPVVDVRVRLVDGKAHSVDSSDMAFQVAGALAVRDAAGNAGLTLLEPLLAVTVLVPDEFVGPVTSDLATRRGRVTGLEPVGAGSGRTAVHAEVPELEMVRYAVDVRSLTQGTGSFSRKPSRYEPLPAHVATALLPA